MIRLCTSNLVEALADALGDSVGADPGNLYEPRQLIVPNALVETFVKQRLAARLGVAANFKTRGLQGFLRDVARQSAPDTRIVDRDAIEGELLALLYDGRRSALVELEPVRAYLTAGGDDAGGLDRRRVQLAAKLAGLFDAYAFSRPEMLAAWREGRLAPEVDPTLQRWQRELWLALFGRGGVFAAAGAVTLPDFFAGTPPEALRAPPVHVFGLSYVARLYRSIFASLGRATTVHIYALNPCREFWEDLEPRRRGGRDARRFPRRRAGEQLTLGGTVEDRGAPEQDSENPLLARWGRPGRDNVRLLNQLTDCDFESRFEDPAAAAPRPSLLATLQQEVLDRLPAGRERPGPDGSLVVWPTSDPRRELETVATEIWALVRRDEERERRGEPGRPLRFSDFAVIVPPASAPAMLPLARAVFQDASELPHTIVDLPSPADGRIQDAVDLLLALPGSPLGRPDLLRLAMHPTVARRFPEVDPEDWLTLSEEVQIVHGADRHDHEGSYLDHDRVSWDQGLTRLALGAFLSGRPSGEERPFALGDEDYLPAELAAGGEPAARALGILARELIAFAQAARGAPAPPADWLALMRGAIAATVRPEGPEEETALGDCLAVLESVSGSLPPGLRTSFLVAADLVRARIREPRASGHRAPEGVTVASFVPMRALPFRVVFLVGLDERVFPSTEGPDALDLRAAGVGREGDVTPRQRDEYMFLETLLSARERLYLSYVARDEITGDGRDPSSVVLTLRDVLGGELADAVTRPRPPLLRHADPAACAVIPAAARERQAAALGGTLRQAAGVIQLPPVADLRAALAPETWAALAPRLGWLAPDAASDPDRARPAARRSLTLADLRRFLECPLQGSVRVLLPLRGEDEAADDAEVALREHENLEDLRAETTPLLREVLARALTAGGDDAALDGAYEAATAVKQLDGTLPSGLFGRAMRLRHLTLLRAWRDGLAAALGGGLPERLEPLWLGGAPEHRRDVTLHPAIRLELPLPEGPAVVELGGMTERLATSDGLQIAVTFISSANDDNVDRDFLRAWLTRLALAASGHGAGQPFGALLIRPPKNSAKLGVRMRVFAPLSAEAARGHLAALASEQLGAIHPYFLPCEAIFSWRNTAKARERGLRGNVLFLRDDNFTRFRSDVGPVPDPRLYPVPSEAEAAAIVARRYQPFFDAGTDPAESDRADTPGRRKGKRP